MSTTICLHRGCRLSKTTNALVSCFAFVLGSCLSRGILDPDLHTHQTCTECTSHSYPTRIGRSRNNYEGIVLKLQNGHLLLLLRRPCDCVVLVRFQKGIRRWMWARHCCWFPIGPAGAARLCSGTQSQKNQNLDFGFVGRPRVYHRTRHIHDWMDASLRWSTLGRLLVFDPDSASPHITLAFTECDLYILRNELFYAREGVIDDLVVYASCRPSFHRANASS
jgi:hypothetical protein